MQAKKKEAERKSTFQRIEKSPLPVVHAAEQTANMVGASPIYVQQAKQIAKDTTEILDHVKQGKLSIPQAKKVAALPVQESFLVRRLVPLEQNLRRLPRKPNAVSSP
jgi:hypothetical protein